MFNNNQWEKTAKKVGLFESNLVPVIGKHVFGNLYDVDDSAKRVGYITMPFDGNEKRNYIPNY